MIAHLETDVLIIGGGVAGLRAAIESAKYSTNVIIITKKKLARSGSSVMSSGAFAVPLGCNDSVEAFIADVVKGGCSINDSRLVAVLAQEVVDRLYELEKWGVCFPKRGRSYAFSLSGEHSFPRVIAPLSGKGLEITQALEKQVIANGCRVLDNLIVVDLLGDGERVTGAICVNRVEPSLIVIWSKTTILATGGAGQLFKVTSNPKDITGDGFAMALRAGATLRDMEFIQFYPWRIVKPAPFEKTRVPIQPSTFALGAKLLNSKGESFMEAYDPIRKEATSRDIAARAIYEQIRAGRDIDGGVLLDLSDLSDEEFTLANPKAAIILRQAGVSPRSVRLILAPEAHFFMGGIRTDTEGQSELRGLLAAGEVAGGVHGANRLNGCAIAEALVFGRRSGARAGQVSCEGGICRKDDLGRIDYWKKRVGDIRKSGRTANSEEITRLLDQVKTQAESSLGIVRCKEKLQSGRELFEDIYHRAIEITPKSMEDFCSLISLENLCTVALACSEAALFREESRGAHYREDYPQTDNEKWLATVIIRRNEYGRVLAKKETIRGSTCKW